MSCLTPSAWPLPVLSPNSDKSSFVPSVVAIPVNTNPQDPDFVPPPPSPLSGSSSSSYTSSSSESARKKAGRRKGTTLVSRIEKKEQHRALLNEITRDIRKHYSDPCQSQRVQEAFRESTTLKEKLVRAKKISSGVLFKAGEVHLGPKVLASVRAKKQAKEDKEKASVQKKHHELLTRQTKAYFVLEKKGDSPDKWTVPEL